VFLYVVASQAAYLVVVRLANGAGELSPGRGYSAYLYAFTLWQLPHAIVAVSVITALLPRMSSAAADGRTADLRASLERGLRLTVSVLVPAAVAFVVLGREMATVVFARLNISVEQAQFIGLLLASSPSGSSPSAPTSCSCGRSTRWPTRGRRRSSTSASTPRSSWSTWCCSPCCPTT
jgi:putative peptidoglycan lipid II flippase